MSPLPHRKEAPTRSGLLFLYNDDMENTYIPRGDIVLIKVDETKRQTDSGILIKEDWKTLPPTGVVVAIGPHVRDLAVGDSVVFERYSSITLDDELRLCKDQHVLAVKHETVRR